MNREEAIEVIKQDIPCEHDTDLIEALDMAIKALDQEPCGNAIDRAEAIKVASGYCHPANVANELAKLPPVNPQPCEDAISRQAALGCCRNEWEEEVEERLKSLPPVNPTKTGWIPVSERLPEDKTYVLTTIKVPNRIAHARSGWYEGGFFHNDNGDVWKATDMEVVAWMPLPAPYEPQERSGKE